MSCVCLTLIRGKDLTADKIKSFSTGFPGTSPPSSAYLDELNQVGAVIFWTAQSTLPETLAPSADYTVSHRIYSPLAADSDPFSAHEPHYLVINAMTPSTESEGQFNSWYWDEHIPLLQKVPGWIDSKRFELITFTEETSQPPKYLALHAWKSQDSFGTQEFKNATNTPWRTQVIGSVVHKEREVLKYLGRVSS